jgi:membrane-associated phospholipid phosphatase
MINTKVWLTLRSSYGFHWFDGGGDYSGFPSGHMAVFTALVLPVVRCFPRLKFVCLVLLLLLGVALIVTGYHFLSDVIAGALLGYLVDRGSWRLLPKDAEERHEEAAPGVLEEVPHPDSTRRLVL